MEPEGSLLPYPEPDQSFQRPLPTSWRYFLILSSHLRLGLPSNLFSSSPPPQKLCSRLSFLHYIPDAQPISFFLISWLEQYWGEQYRSLSYSLCSFLHSPVTSSLIGPNILLNTLFSDTVSLSSSLCVTDQDSNPCNTTCVIIFVPHGNWALGGADGWGTALQTGSSWVLFPVVLLSTRFLNRNEFQEYFLGLNAADNLTTIMWLFSFKFSNLNFLEPSGPLQDCTGIPLTAHLGPKSASVQSVYCKPDHNTKLLCRTSRVWSESGTSQSLLKASVWPTGMRMMMMMMMTTLLYGCSSFVSHYVRCDLQTVSPRTVPTLTHKPHFYCQLKHWKF